MASNVLESKQAFLSKPVSVADDSGYDSDLDFSTPLHEEKPSHPVPLVGTEDVECFCCIPVSGRALNIFPRALLCLVRGFEMLCHIRKSEVRA
jgi:hypothetical protein